MKRDIPREEIGEIIEESMIRERHNGNMFLERCKVELVADGHVEIKLFSGKKYRILVQQIKGTRA